MCLVSSSKQDLDSPKFGKKFGKKCRNEHPEICKTFSTNGLTRHNTNGCDSKCGLFHPNACRGSLKEKICEREECRFYHIKGTKFTNVEKKQNNDQTENLGNSKGNLPKKDQVFQIDSLEIMIAIREMRQEMADLKKQNLEMKESKNKSIQPKLSPPGWQTQSQKKGKSQGK